MKWKHFDYEPFYEVEVNWTRPRIYENAREYYCEHDDGANFYIISGRFGKNQEKIFYIGKTHKQYVNARLNQPDHKKRYEKITQWYPKHTLYVRYGRLNMCGSRNTKARISDIERILIYSCDSEHIINEKNFWNHNVKGAYLIRNTGYRSILKKSIFLGLFTAG